MKRVLFVFSLVVIGASCVKKSPSQGCYTFYISDSISSNVPTLAKKTLDSENHCGYTDDMRNGFIKQHTGVDTFYNKNDTIEVHHFLTTWDFL